MAATRTFVAGSLGIAAGVGLAAAGLLSAPQRSNPLVVAELAIDPTAVVLAGVAAAALPALMLRCSPIRTLVLALGGAMLCWLGVNFVHWAGPIRPGRAGLEWRMDLAAATLGVVVSAVISAGIASQLREVRPMRPAARKPLPEAPRPEAPEPESQPETHRPDPK